MTGELKNKIDGLWEIFWTGGITNPLEVVEQMTYLMFIRDIDSADNIRAKEAAMLGLPFKSIFDGEVEIGGRKVEGEQLKWSVFHDFPAQRMYNIMQEWVFPFIKNLHGDKNSAYSKYMRDAIFKVNTPLMLSKIVDAMDEMAFSALKEVGNIIICSYINAFSQLVGVDLNLSVPSSTVNMLGGILTVPMVEFGYESEKLMYCNADFLVDGKSIPSWLLMLPDIHSLNTILEKLGV